MVADGGSGAEPPCEAAKREDSDSRVTHPQPTPSEGPTRSSPIAAKTHLHPYQ